MARANESNLGGGHAMNERQLRERLSSPDRNVVLDALYVLGGEKHAPPSDETLHAACRHLKHIDPDIRAQAAFAIAIHWGFEACFPELLRLLSVEQDEQVAESLILAVGRLGTASPALRDVSLQVLARLSLTPDRARRLRSLAFIESKRVAGKMNPREYAEALVDPDKVDVDTTWASGIVAEHPDRE